MPAFTENCQFVDIELDDRPGHYYVSVANGYRYQLLSGPYDTHAEALAKVDAAKDIAISNDPRAHWYAFGTCRMDICDSPRDGKLQEWGYLLDLKGN